MSPSPARLLGPLVFRSHPLEGSTSLLTYR